MIIEVQNSQFHVFQILIGVNYFKEIKRFLHISYGLVKNDDKHYKLFPAINKIHKRLRLVPIEEGLGVDQKVILLKGKSSLKQYNPRKPRKLTINFLFSVTYLVLVITSKFSLETLMTYVHQMIHIWGQAAMLLFNLQGLHLTSAFINFTRITGSIVFCYKFSCMDVVFLY